MTLADLVFRNHALQRISERMITTDDVLLVRNSGETIENYPNDQPYPSRLVLGWKGPRPIHVVAANERETGRTIVVTVYEPDRTRWDGAYRTRRTT